MEKEVLLEKFKSGSVRALGRIITLVENSYEDAKYYLNELKDLTGKAHVIGFTGSPGAGKSSLIDSLVEYLRKQNLRVGVIAIDPSSPFTGGAILGDRIRMIRHSTDKGVFIRSMANRGQTGGLGIATKDTIKILDAFGFDVIIVETVGTGQTEIDIVKTADTVVVVQNPEAGDDIQAIKAGIMEIADLFVINKSDLAGANRAKINIETAVHESNPKNSWEIPVIMTSSYKNEGFDKLWEKLKDHNNFLRNSDYLLERRFFQIREEVIALLDYKLKKYTESKLKQNEFVEIIKDANMKNITSRDAADYIFEKL
ncbi:MAG: methylmalonyl Co-A mutase-associated GTPase MeaB [Candidatus Sericytochromatia bacterium]